MEGIGNKIRSLINGVDKMDWDGITILRPHDFPGFPPIASLYAEFEEFRFELHNIF